MKKRILSVLAISLGVVATSALIAFGLLQLVRQENVIETGNVLGVEWYDETKTEFTISTAEELLEFAKLSDFYSFKDQVVKLDADIVWNEGNAEEWAENPPAKKWNSINKFAGTFDGQGHTISGVYMKGYEARVAMFINPDYKCTVQNFKLVNSYIETAGFTGTASIVSGGGGKFVGIYSDAIINHKGENVAGIGSTITKQSTFEECQFDGVITTNNRDCGGIIDEINGGRVNMRHCLFSGVINNSYDFGGTRTGGLIGFVYKTSAAIIQDSLVSGKINCDKTPYTGSVVGVGYVESQTTVNDTYAATGAYAVTVATTNGTWTGTPLGIKDEKLIGVKAYQWTSLDFDKYWSAVEGGTPVLKRFGGKGLDLTGVAKAFDTSWYTSGGYNFEIKTLEQFYGMYYVSAKDKFADKVIKLGADIVMNTGKASDWEKNAPANEWIAIPTFEGTFDGQGHTISGIYSRGASTYQGIFGIAKENSVIKNFSIKNSFYYKENSSLAGLGSVVGDSYGIVENIYSNAILISEGAQVGGIAGRQNDNDSNGKEDCMTIRNCWFDGSVSLKGEKTMEAGGIVGRAVQGDLVMEHCLNTGTISSEATGTGLHIGGLIGRGNSKTIKVSDCLTVGKIVCNYNVCVGSTFGRLPNKDSVVTIENVYASKEAYKDPIGTSSPAQKNGGVVQFPEEWFIGNNAYKYTELDFPNYWALVKNGNPILQSFATSDPSTKGLVKAVDTSWYTKDAKEYVIKTPSQLFGFAMKAMQDNFQGKTVKLGANINVSSLGVNWIPIGTRDKVFKGTFDGQGYTISGVTHKSDSQDIGLFGSIDNTAVLKNFRLVDSTFEYYSEEANEKEVKIWLGSVCADMRGDLENIYSNALVISNGSRVGGIAGMPNGSKGADGKLTTSTMKNCWFDGEVRLHGRYARFAGGIAGQSMQGTIEFIHCLNTGKVSNERPDAGEFLGGIIGSEQNGGQTILIEDCLNIGTVTGKNWNMIGAIVGGTNTGSSVYNIINTYALNTSCVKPDGSMILANHWKGTLNSAAQALSKEELNGYEPFKWTELDATHWVAIANGTPELKYFSTGMNMAGIEKMYDTSWYSADKKEFTITTAKQLYGLSILSGTNTFKGQTFKLGNDIDMSAYDRWVSIGNLAKPFEGTFDGQDYVISNMTQKTATMYAGLIGYTKMATVKNVIIKDSTFESTATASAAYIGGIIGGGNGTLLDSYSNANVVSTGVGVGGLIGRSTAFDISGCWYDGAITVNYTGSDSVMVGGLLGTGATKKTTIDNCAFTGSVDVQFQCTDEEQETWGCRVAGIVGGDGKAPIEISNTLSSGIVHVAWNNNSTCLNPKSVVRTNSVIGWVENADTKTKGNVYASTKVSTYVENTNTTTNPTAPYTEGVDGSISFTVASMAEVNLIGVEGYRYTDLDFDEYWAARKDEVPGIKKFVENPLSVANVVKPDTSWYSDNEEEFHITNEADFFGFTKLVASGKTFQDKAVYLDVDIELNEVKDGTITAWKNGEKPENPWMMIGTPDNIFRGTFDGQMHTVSGAYSTNSGQYNGLFGYVLGATIKNLKIVDSYFESTPELNSFIGGVVGGGNGKVQNCYTAATIYSTGILNGGIVGRSTGFTIDGCWFDGHMMVDYVGEKSMYVGGILGTGTSKESVISNCLVTGTLDLTFEATSPTQQTWRGRVGSIAGGDDNVKLTVSDCIAAGEFNLTWLHNEGATKLPENMIDVFNPIGYKQNASSSYESQVYTLMENTLRIEDVPTWAKTMTTNTKEEDILGMDGFYNTVLDFVGYWAARDGKIPALKKFVPTEEQLPVPNDLLRPDTSWYSDSKTEFHIKDEADFLGFTKLVSSGKKFQNQVVFLDVDIELNEVEDGTIATWKSGQRPSNVWTAVGSVDYPFYGTFDGQMHTISGIYTSMSAFYNGLFGYVQGATIKNIKLVDSYFETTSPTNAFMGSIVGGGYGKVQDCYTNASMYSTGIMVGGIVGRSTGFTIDGCWFDGDMVVNYKGTESINVGGILGSGATNPTTISNCLVTGDLDLSFTATNAAQGNWRGRIGSVAGADANVKLTVSDCIVTGNYTATWKHNSETGSTTPSNMVDVFNPIGYKQHAESSFDSHVYTMMTSDLRIEDTPTWVQKMTTNSKEEEMLGLDGFYNTVLDFAEYWAARDRKVPALKKFVPEAEQLEVPLKFIKHDTSWYSESATKYYIDSAEAMYGFMDLMVGGNVFEGKTIYLTNDIALNEIKSDTVEKWIAGTETALNKWTPAGYDARTSHFKGTFDGQGHTISGLYIKSDLDHVGLFGAAGAEAVIKDFSLVDSYVYTSATSTGHNLKGYAYAGSVVGQLAGTIEDVYSNAYVSSPAPRIGGIVGVANCRSEVAADKYVNIKRCWFDGKLVMTSSTGRYGGGIAGHVMQKRINFEDCLFTGYISAEYTNGGTHIGGIFGQNQNAAQVKITNCLSAGTMEVWDSCTGSLVGYAQNKSGTTYTVTNSYGTKECYAKTIGNNAVGVSPAGTIVNLADIKGKNAVTALANFNFDKVWTTREGNVPALRIRHTVVEDISWYNSETKTYVLSTANELMGLALLSEEGNTFEGVTIKLGKDIEFNDVGKAILDEWIAGTATPRNIWIPIGYKSGTAFQGTFDGQGHTISGLYFKDFVGNAGFFGSAGAKSTVKNVRIVDSYMSSTTTNLGSIIGWGSGKLENCYSNAYVKSTAQQIGGLVGKSAGLDMKGCWFDGTVYQVINSDLSRAGGLVGCCGDNDGSTIDTCLYTGSLTVDGTRTSTAGFWGMRVGGFAGGDEGKSLEVKNSISAGKLQFNWIGNPETANSVSRICQVIGWAQSANTKTNGNVYCASTIKTVINKKGTNVDGTITKVYEASGTISFTTVSTTKDALLGADGSTLTKLTFGDNGWTKRDGKVPVPTALKDVK